ncbi:LysR substrate-binding domain-containing protein [Phenylobacterium sp.]|jgi:LysR family glycine cleavage system transcriptional activator|uniref:LysR substrate-binding domain-containing protein n=1 Tax=Phenylobacterium sp. TaxID=1871053 RepID=UPI003783C3A9
MNQHANVLAAKADRLEIPPFAVLRAFEAVGRCGGIRRAAAQLRIDHTVVSRHLRTLEAVIGVELYERNSGLTEAGQAYYERISRAIHDMASATADTIGGKGLSRLKICCVPGFGFQWLAARLSSFRAAHPDIDLEFHPTDIAPDLLRHEADVDIRFATDQAAMAPSASVRAYEFTRSVAVAVASPPYLARIGPVRTVADLLGATLVHEENAGQWQRFLAAHDVEIAGELPGPKMWHAHATLEAARSGEGVALTNRFLLRDDLDQGRLVLVGPEATAGFPKMMGGYWVMATQSRWRQPSVQAFRNWLVGEVKKGLPGNAHLALAS